MSAPDHMHEAVANHMREALAEAIADLRQRGVIIEAAEAAPAAEKPPELSREEILAGALERSAARARRWAQEHLNGRER